MASYRTKVSAVKRDFQAELDRLENFDTENQRRFVATIGRPNGLSRRQLYLLTESIFFAGFRLYEGFLRDLFLLYCMEKAPSSGKRVKSYLQPRSFSHAEQLIQSSMPFLDWTSPAAVINRAELYLRDGFPVKMPLSTNQAVLTDFKKIRNHIAHGSPQSLNDYKKVLLKHYRTLPLIIPSPGEFLLETERKPPRRYKLQSFIAQMRAIAEALT